MADPSLPVSDTADARDLNGQVNGLSRLPPFTPAVIPFAVIGGDPLTAGVQASDTDVFEETHLFLVRVTAPVLHYDLQALTSFGVGITSVEWQVDASFASGVVAVTTVASGSVTTSTTVAGSVDLFGLLGPLVFTELMTLTLYIKRTGGSGQAAVRVLAPWRLEVT